ncbi:MAG TPA: hypothetical protein PLP17_14195, partial [Oligoflexia bacterium]|nr:hypothetical protein [Oligoflexia bacterium]
GPAPSCKHFPIYGTLGRPSDRPGDKTRAGEVAGLFAAARDGRLRARLGDYFAPLENLQDQTGDVANATLDAAQYINSGDKTYQDIFTIEPPLHVGNNFPLMRTLRPESAGGDPEGRPRYDPPDPFYDLRLSRPTKLELGDAEGPLGIPSLNLMLDYQRNPRNGAWPEVQNTRQPMAWSNPLCHAEEVGLANDLNQRVRTAKVMVIAPHKENPANAKYCDFRNVFRGQPQNAIPPVADSWPVVVGMIEVNLFDLNFRDLDNHPVFKAELDHYRPLTWVERLFGDDRMISTVTPHYPSAGVFDFGEIVDRHPSELLALPESVLSSIEQARNQIGNFQPVPSCTDCSSESNGNGNSGNSGNSQSCEQCQANAASTQSSNNNLLTSLAEQGFPVSFFWCFDLDDILDVLRQTPGLAECANEMEATEVNQCLNDKKVDFNR